MLELQATDVAQDGSVTLMVGGAQIKFVKESDLGAVKAAKDKAEESLSKLQTDLANANLKLEEVNTSMVKEKAARETAETTAATAAQLKATVEELQTKMADQTKVSGELSTKLADSIRTNLVQNHRFDAEKIKDMDLAGLETALSTASMQNNSQQRANFDGGSPPGGSAQSLEGKSPLQLATMGYEQGGKSNK